MDPVRNPYAPGAGQRPPELAGRDAELSGLRRRAGADRARPPRALAGAHRPARRRQDRAAQPAALGGDRPRLGHRQDRGAARPVAAPAGLLRAAHGAARARPAARRPGVDGGGARRRQGVRAAASRRPTPRCATAGSRASTSPPPPAGPTPATWRSTSSSCSPTPPGVAADIGSGIALFIDEMQDVQPDDVSAICAACHELSQQGAPLIVVGAGLPHLPAVLSASKSYCERLFRYVRIDRLDREAADRALLAPGRARGRRPSSRPRSTPCTRRPTATPTSCRPTARSPGTSPPPRPSPPRTSPWPPRWPRPSSPSASSAPATTGRRPPSASTCTPWPSWAARRAPPSPPRRSRSRWAASRRRCPRRATR